MLKNFSERERHRGGVPKARSTHLDEARITAVQALEVVYGLVQNMKEVIARNKHGSTPLHLALQMEAADILLEQGASVLAQDDSRWTPSHMVSRRGHVEVARMFLEHDADMEARGRRRIGSTAFGFAEGTLACRTCGHVSRARRGCNGARQGRVNSVTISISMGTRGSHPHASRARRQRECPGRGRVDPHYIRRPFKFGATQK